MMDSAAFDLIKNSAMALVSNKLESQREIKRLGTDVSGLRKKIQSSVAAIHDIYSGGEADFSTWESNTSAKNTLMNHALLLLDKSRTERANAQSQGKLTCQNNAQPAKGSGLLFEELSIEAIELEVQAWFLCPKLTLAPNFEATDLH